MDYIQKEIFSQISKWGDNQTLSNLERLCILTEEVGEVAKEVHDLRFEKDYPKHCKGSKERLKKELIQVAAVAVRWLDKLN